MKVVIMTLVLLSMGLSVPAQKAKKPLKATLTAHSVTLTWGVSTVPTGAPPVTGYNVYRGTVPGGEGSTPLASPGNVLTFVDSTVTAGGNFCYQVTGVSTGGESGKSNEVCLTIPNIVAPNPPTNLAGTVQ